MADAQSQSSAEHDATEQFGPNAWLVDEMYEQFRADPNSVSESWREFLADYKPGAVTIAPAPAPSPAPRPGSRPAPSPAPAPAAPAAPAPDEAGDPIRGARAP